MPITATPTVGAPTTCCQPPALTTPVLTPFPWEGQNVLAAPTATVHGRPLLAKMQTYRITGGQEAVLERQLIDRQGNPIDLVGLGGGSASAPVAPYAERYTLKFRLREYLALGQATAAIAEFPVEIVDATQGLVQVSLPATATRRPGVYFGEIAVCGPELDGVEPVLFSNSFYVLVEMGLWADQRLKGPPTIMEVRLHLRDTDPEESFLLDNIAFQDTEIALAIARPVQYWNEVPPPIQTYTTQTFPFRYHWLEGICGQLFLIVAEQHRRNNLQYSAAGVAINDYDKEPNYEQAAMRRWQAFQQFVRHKKAQLNMEGGFGIIGGPYA